MSLRPKRSASLPASDPVEKPLDEVLEHVDSLGVHPQLNVAKALVREAKKQLVDWDRAGRPGGAKHEQG
ncbi:hypothetical protein GCM10011534_12000 [Pseudooceanicola nanhaiensis]|jgi:hypothetical protein|uniref:Uncharacterized protein n=1 Tax=Pseudooceanicola nanhaiensis TaxID=375761 RepID=A0A917SQW2_9RHOB|nr:hypothetical protein GCM10011534_12000 [Pseudooceanicola nanhaiensis]